MGLVSKDVNKESGRCFSFLFWTKTNVGWSNHRSSSLRKTEGCKAKHEFLHTHTHTHTESPFRVSLIHKSNKHEVGFCFFFKSSPEDMFIDLRERERERLRERNIKWLPPTCTLSGDQTHNLGMCPDQESNQQLCSEWNDAPIS